MSIPDQYSDYDYDFLNPRSRVLDLGGGIIPISNPIEDVPTPIDTFNPLDLNLNDNLTNIKDSITGIGTDIFTQGFNKEIFTTKNRLFYIAMVLIIIFVVFIVIRFILGLFRRN